MVSLMSFLKRLDGVCAKLNAGLTAVAIVLTVLVAAEATVRLPDLLEQAALAANLADPSAQGVNAAATAAPPISANGF